jgi:hypothetical protein
MIMEQERLNERIADFIPGRQGQVLYIAFIHGLDPGISAGMTAQ